MREQTPVQIFRLEEKRRQYRNGNFFLRISLLIIFLLTPLIFPSFKIFDCIVKIIIFATLVASYDLLLGYTGCISFGHVMFFGIGAYIMGFFIGKYGSPSYINLIFALFVAAVIAFPLALLISFFSLRIKTIFFAMTTLAIAEFSMILAIKLYNFTGGNDGIVLNVPGIFRVSTSLGKFMGIEITGRVITYYFIFLICLLLFLTMLRFINSPLGRTLQAIRDNSQRAEALGNKTFFFQSFSICIGCVVATITGSLYALWVGYVNPDACLDMSIMINVLLMAIIGGIGTLYGGIVGSGFVQIAQTFLPDLQILAKSLFPHAHLLHKAMERWLLIFGVLFILIIFFFPKGIMGSVREYMTHSNTAHSFGCVGPLKRIVSRMLKKSI